MKVGELIERLKEFDANGIVFVEDTEEGEMVEVDNAYRITYTHEGIGDINVGIVMKDK